MFISADINMKGFTFKHVHHTEEGQGERGFAAARPATDPHLKINNSKSSSIITNTQSIKPIRSILFKQYSLAFMFSYLLSGADVCVDVFQHRLQRGIVSDAQVLDLDLSLSGPALRYLRHSWERHTNVMIWLCLNMFTWHLTKGPLGSSTKSVLAERKHACKIDY